MNFHTNTNKALTLNGVKTKANLKKSQILNTKEFGKVVRYKLIEGGVKKTYSTNSLIKSEVVYQINGIDYNVFYVTTAKVNRSGWLVEGDSLEYNDIKFNSDKKLMEYILS